MLLQIFFISNVILSEREWPTTGFPFEALA